MQIVQTLEYGFSLTDEGKVIGPKGEIFSMDQYEKIIERRKKNRIDWLPIDADEVSDLIDRSVFMAKVRDENISTGYITQLVGIDETGEPITIRIQNFLGADRIEFAHIEWRYLIWIIRQNRPDLLEELSDSLEELFGTTEQVATEFITEDGDVYSMKAFVWDSALYRIIWKNDEISNVKFVEKLKNQAEVGEANDGVKNDIARAIAIGKIK